MSWGLHPSPADLRAQTSELVAQAQQISIKFLRSDLELAATFISVAETTSHPATRLRILNDAWRALQAMEEFAANLKLERPERREFREMYFSLCLRLVKQFVRL